MFARVLELELELARELVRIRSSALLVAFHCVRARLSYFRLRLGLRVCVYRHPHPTRPHATPRHPVSAE